MKTLNVIVHEFVADSWVKEARVPPESLDDDVSVAIVSCRGGVVRVSYE